jgi:hypothetical protein
MRAKTSPLFEIAILFVRRYQIAGFIIDVVHGVM